MKCEAFINYTVTEKFIVIDTWLG